MAKAIKKSATATKNKLLVAMNETGTTGNGATTLLSSLDANVDLFYLLGASRGKDITAPFEKALNNNADVAIRTLLHGRDARQGAGERQQFRNLLDVVVKRDPELAVRVINRVPELGRYDDVLHLIDPTKNAQVPELVRQATIEMYMRGLASENGLCAKWLPRQGPAARVLREAMELSPKSWRKLLVSLSKTVEQDMCAQRWDKIDYEHVPSVAAARYQATFKRHDEKRYAAYANKLEKGEAKINASAIFPHDVIRSLAKGDEKVANAQWASLPDYAKDSTENAICVVDVSGSMGSVNYYGYAHSTSTVQPIEVALALGLYTSERLNGPFKNTFITFSESPTLQTVNGTLSNRMRQMNSSAWGMSTNLQAVFTQILNAAVKHGVPESDMPSKVIIISDMEFNSCVNGTNYQSIEKKYKAAGYKLPAVVFWNVNGRVGNIPAKADAKGVALVSGFSPSILMQVLGGNADDFTPEAIMLKTVMSERYAY